MNSLKRPLHRSQTRKMRNVSRNKLWHCFRPMVDMDVVIEPKSVNDHRSTDLGSTYIKVESMEPLKVSMDSEKSSTIIRQQQQQPTKKTFSRVVRAVFFETTLAKRVRERKGFKQDSVKPKLRSSDLFRFELMNSTLPGSSSSSSSSTSESEISTRNNLTDSVKQNYKKKIEKYSKESDMGHSGFNSGLYLLLISLTITVFWGRFWAVVLSLIWLYLVPAWYAGSRLPDNATRWPENESKDYKKVIIEGLLERNHRKEH
ncbi:hypothetical protein PanWU01x14_000790 [Parasponia andersonii]|uniref:Transmembrane protein n=1 Tax=Parasponia andersonii TaxID=3476 RepID=A0A2P5E4R2_PARAD|nr:hypothetical protein PanWU01x14_000790 [Parasponia andersonii]